MLGTSTSTLYLLFIVGIYYISVVLVNYNFSKAF